MVERALTRLHLGHLPRSSEESLRDAEELEQCFMTYQGVEKLPRPRSVDPVLYDLHQDWSNGVFHQQRPHRRWQVLWSPTAAFQDAKGLFIWTDWLSLDQAQRRLERFSRTHTSTSESQGFWALPLCPLRNLTTGLKLSPSVIQLDE